MKTMKSWQIILLAGVFLASVAGYGGWTWRKSVLENQRKVLRERFDDARSAEFQEVLRAMEYGNELRSVIVKWVTDERNSGNEPDSHRVRAEMDGVKPLVEKQYGAEINRLHAATERAENSLDAFDALHPEIYAAKDTVLKEAEEHRRRNGVSRY